MQIDSQPLRRSMALLISASLLAAPLNASVEEAHSFAMEAAAPHVGGGFVIRGEPWSGELARGGRKVIRHQLFRGNEYWFWVGTPTPDCEIVVRVYDRKGRPVHVETKRDKHWAAARVMPPKSGSYLIVVTTSKGEGAKVKWSLSYGYR